MAVLTQSAVRSDGSTFNSVVQFENSSGTQNGTLCRAWVNFNGTFGTSPFTIANGGIRASFNVSSVSDLATGYYRVNFLNAMPDAKYSVLALSDPYGVENESYLCILGYAGYTTVNNFILGSQSDQYNNTGPGLNDKSIVNVAVFR